MAKYPVWSIAQLSPDVRCGVGWHVRGFPGMSQTDFSLPNKSRYSLEICVVSGLLTVRFAGRRGFTGAWWNMVLLNIFDFSTSAQSPFEQRMAAAYWRFGGRQLATMELHSKIDASLMGQLTFLQELAAFIAGLLAPKATWDD